MIIKRSESGWTLRLEPSEDKKLQICWGGVGVNQRFDVEWIEIVERDSYFKEKDDAP
jgi:hypothetical protein